MGLKVVGAGLGRTGTLSLKGALERLLGGPCYHMMEVFGRPDAVATWQRAIDGEPVDWSTFLGDYTATVDWPAAAFWKEILAANRDALVVLSHRPTEQWWTSANETIFSMIGQPLPPDPGMRAHMTMVHDMFRVRFTDQLGDRDAAIAAYERHNADVRATAPPAQLLEWSPSDGWDPLCAALGVAVPDEPFPRVNTTAEFKANFLHQ
jgi:Sulfotransferase domain